VFASSQKTLGVLEGAGLARKLHTVQSVDGLGLEGEFIWTEKETAPDLSEFASNAEVKEDDVGLLNSLTGREDGRGLAGEGEIPASEIARPLGGSRGAK
jgi:hypothetical protein